MNNKPKPQSIFIVGSGFCHSIGGIQKMTKMVIDQLSLGGILAGAVSLIDCQRDMLKHFGNKINRKTIFCCDKNLFRFLLKIIYVSICKKNNLLLCTHINYLPLLGLFVGFSNKRLGVFVYAYEMSILINKIGKKTLRQHIELYAIKRCVNVVAISNYSKQIAINLGAKPENIRVLHLGVVDRNSGSPRNKNIENRIIFVGRLADRYKGLNELINSLKRLRDAKIEVKLDIVGDGPLRGVYEKLVEELDVTSIVTFHGFVPDEQLDHLYKNASVFVMVSENEGFGLVYCEAMSYGLPCICSTVDAASEIVVNGKTGYCVEPRDVNQLVEKIKILLNDGAIRLEMSANARKRYEECFSISSFSERLVGMLYGWSKELK